MEKMIYDIPIYNTEEVIEDCTVWLETLIVAGEVIAGWWPGGIADRPKDKMKHIAQLYEVGQRFIEHCTIQIWSSKVTGQQSVGWWRGGLEDMPGFAGGDDE